jgi:hypothetical protein
VAVAIGRGVKSRSWTGQVLEGNNQVHVRYM